MPRNWQEVTLEEVSGLFHLPIAQAAEKLSVCVSIVKRICRSFGIPRWPYRKFKSLDRNIHKLRTRVEQVGSSLCSTIVEPRHHDAFDQYRGVLGALPASLLTTSQPTPDPGRNIVTAVRESVDTRMAFPNPVAISASPLHRISEFGSNSGSVFLHQGSGPDSDRGTAATSKQFLPYGSQSGMYSDLQGSSTKALPPTGRFVPIQTMNTPLPEMPQTLAATAEVTRHSVAATVTDQHMGVMISKFVAFGRTQRITAVYAS
eukprot:TRINITY_DN10592_c1_g1_i1.p1 TRINITY_DN10592_c1_g1~~TRINITY_DN10592_c1_g1_i1.p1  ORF type:complete len:260 (-),score=10.37 TRINITY_DN10592_c1_g1_i1:144-923(-)